MRRSDKFFFGGMAVYAIGGVAALFTGVVPIEVVQLVWLASMALPLVWPRFAKWLGIRPLWGK